MTPDSGLKTVLITGGCGFIGTNLVKYLSERGCQVRLLDNLTTNSGIWTPNSLTTQRTQGAASTQATLDSRLSTLDLTVGDIREREVVEKAVTGVDAVVHLAAHTSVVKSLENPEENLDINVKGTLNLLQACRRHGVEKFIFASSNTVVGKQTPPIDETKIPQPLSPYGASKLAGESLCSSYYHSFGLKTLSLRFANCYGPYCDRKSSVVATFMRWAKQGKPLIIYGDGDQTRDFIHVEDICQAIHLSLTTTQPPLSTQQAQQKQGARETALWGEVFQTASGVETSINQLAELTKEVTGNRLQTIHEAERKGEIRRNYSDIAKARARLGFEPEINLRRGLLDLWEWYNSPS